ESIIQEQAQNQKVILPLSGGLDSRTQSAAIHQLKKNEYSYSYELRNGHPETSYSKKIAEVCQFPFKKMVIPENYLWNHIEEAAQLNGCYSEFTHPRQIAVMSEWQNMGDVFSLGHWGDVLFDDMRVPENLPFQEQVDMLYKKVLKKNGMYLAELLWKGWQIEGNFGDYLRDRIETLLRKIDIPHSANAQIRAFKSLYWATRWTAVNLIYFEKIKPITLPYFDNRMCEFVCRIPEEHLAGRQIQIEYLKMRNPNLAKITWEDKRPFDLYNYHLNKFPYNFPFRVYQKIKNEVFTRKVVRNNYENQFLGKENDLNLKHWLFENPDFANFVGKNITKEVYHKFTQENHLMYSHTISTLLTLSLFTSICQKPK
ncbi:MAG: asparagine synthetase B family protein, partial [Flavobacteriaceae bacterium]|nr:asparagine synthetase B family protein [Flavobacteriaceae bacterium]